MTSDKISIIKYGEEKEFHTGYKCRIRKRWYITPSLWIPQGFALRQVNRYPKLVLNQVEASSTDTIHRVRFISEVFSPESIVVCFLNSLTFAYSEVSLGAPVTTFFWLMLLLPVFCSGEMKEMKIFQQIRCSK